MAPNLTLSVLPDTFAVCRLPAPAPIPPWAIQGDFFAVTRTAAELSIVCSQAQVPAAGAPDLACERDWRSLQVAGPLDFGLTGILSAIAAPLAAANISIFALSTYDTDYVMVKVDALTAAIAALKAAGFIINQPPS